MMRTWLMYPMIWMPISTKSFLQLILILYYWLMRSFAVILLTCYPKIPCFSEEYLSFWPNSYCYASLQYCFLPELLLYFWLPVFLKEYGLQYCSGFGHSGPSWQYSGSGSSEEQVVQLFCLQEP